MTADEKARMLVEAIRQEMDLGTKYYSRSGDYLPTMTDIMKALIQDGALIFEIAPMRQASFQHPLLTAIRN